MIVSVNWLKKFVDIDLSIDELATRIGARLVEIEGVESLGEKYRDVLVAKVVTCEPVPDSDHLNLTTIDDGGKANNVERNKQGYVQVVCGAPNVTAGMTVAWLPPGATVPETYDDEEPFVLGARKLRGFMSNGMIASAKELDLFEDHTGILELDRSLRAGDSFGDALELDDYLLDIENKSLTHRPDTFGVIGFAREVAAIQDKAFATPQWLRNETPQFAEGSELTLTAVIDDTTLSSRYQAAVIGGVSKTAVTPLDIQSYLARSGVRPISPVVDVTNYVMLVSGQPLHAFDYDKLIAHAGSGELHVRAGKAGETLELLDGRVIDLDVSDIIIAAGSTPVALAGASGGLATAIDDTTSRIVLESATFNLYNLRTTQMRHGIFSEAITRFTKGQPAGATAPVLAEAARLLHEWTGATLLSPVVDVYPGAAQPASVTLPIAYINAVLGSDYGTETIVATLERVECSVTLSGDAIVVTPPYWRSDLHIPEDIIEEIGRINGYDDIAPVLPVRPVEAVHATQFTRWTTTLRHELARAGANEVLTYSFVHGDLLRKVGQLPDDAFRIVNAISPDLQYYRLSLTPSLLDKVTQNLRQKFDEFVLFEINKVHQKGVYDAVESDVPAESPRLGLVIAKNSKQAQSSGTAYYGAKAYLEYVLGRVHTAVSYRVVADTSPATALTLPFEPKRSAEVVVAGVVVGVVGEYRASVARQFKLPQYAAGFELDLEALYDAQYVSVGAYRPSSRYPSSEQDICFKVAVAVPYQQVVDVARGALDASVEYESEIAPVDIYQAEADTTKNITIRIRLTSHDRTLTNEDVATTIESVTAAVVKQTHAVVV